MILLNIMYLPVDGFWGLLFYLGWYILYSYCLTDLLSYLFQILKYFIFSDLIILTKILDFRIMKILYCLIENLISYIFLYVI